ncbi:MAG: tetratricopeptide repeat protein [Deltaproteobacteria bacterium]|nr:tetratricopeptide repeat protein [Deltaproteobacteria bacterium]
MGLKENILEKAQKFIQKGQLDKAIAEYRNAADVDAKDISIRLRIGDLFVKMGHEEDAIKEYMDVAKVNTQKGFYLKAIAVYKQVLKLDAANIDVHNKLADLYTKQRLIVDAINEYSFLLSTFEKKGRMDDAIELLKKMVGIDPENVGIRLKIADCYHKQGFHKDSLGEYSIIFAKLTAQGKADKAEKIYHTLLRIYPKEPQIHIGLGGLYKAKGDIAQYLRHAHQLANIYKDKGDEDKAKSVAEEILTVRPDDAESLGFLSHFNVPAAGEKKVEQVSKEAVLAAMDITDHEEEPLIDFDLIEAEVKPKVEEPRKAPEVKAEKTEEAPLIDMPDFALRPSAPAPSPEIEIELEGFESPARVEPLQAETGAPAAREAEIEISHEVVEIEPVEAAPEAHEHHEELAEISIEEEVVEEALTLEPHVEEPAFAEGPSAMEEGGEGMEGAGEDEFVDLAAEIGLEDLGLENLFKDMAESFAKGGDKATVEEFKSGIESQLGKEDSETHYNLGIAYMEMELFTEACKEFKIAAKDHNIEFDCYARLGLCYMSQAKPDEAITYYLKSLKVKNRGEEERKGAMYELALAYEAAESKDEAAELYRAIHAIDPAYREVAAKMKEFKIETGAGEGEGGAPTDDGMLEVELL